MPGLGDKLLAQLLAFVQELRAENIRKPPSIAESVDWARTLLLLHADSLSESLVRDTLGVLMKRETDLREVYGRLGAMTRAANAARWMDSNLVTFVRALRSAGAEPSMSETIDAARAVALVGYGDRAGLKAALGMALAKSDKEKRIYDKVFDLYFTSLSQARPQAPTDLAKVRTH